MKVIEKPTRFRKTLEELQTDICTVDSGDPWEAAVASLKPPRPPNSLTREEFCQKFGCDPTRASKLLNALVQNGKADATHFVVSAGHRVKLWVLK